MIKCEYYKTCAEYLHFSDEAKEHPATIRNIVKSFCMADPHKCARYNKFSAN